MGHKSGFRIIGVIERKFIANSGKFCALTVVTNIDGRKAFMDLKGFSDVLADVENVEKGDTVEVVGSVASEKLTAKDRSEVMVDGRVKYVPALIMRSIAPSEVADAPKGHTARGASTSTTGRAPATTNESREPQSVDDDSIPF